MIILMSRKAILKQTGDVLKKLDEMQVSYRIQMKIVLVINPAAIF